MRVEIFLGRTRTESLDFVGLTESYGQSLRLFRAIFGVTLAEYSVNVTKERPDDHHAYLKERGTYEDIKDLMASNSQNYEQARACFDKLSAELEISQ